MKFLSKLTQGLVRGTTVAHNHEQAGATPAPATISTHDGAPASGASVPPTETGPNNRDSRQFCGAAMPMNTPTSSRPRLAHDTTKASRAVEVVPSQPVTVGHKSEPYMQVVCAWCKQSMGRKLCVPEMDGHVSHSICGPCFAEDSVPDLCRKIKEADIYVLVKIALDDLRTVEGGVANGLRELVRRRLEQLVYENHKPEDDL